MFKHILLLLILIGAFLLWEQRPISHGDGVVAPEQPVLQKVGLSSNQFDLQHYKVKPRYRVQGELRMIAKKSYWFDDKKHISPYDFILGWDAMSDERVLSQINLPISNRNYKIDVIQPPLSFGEMKNRMMFVHAIPSSEEVLEAMRQARPGSIISFKGFIVDIEDQSDWSWSSSIQGNTSRLDGSQILWIQEFNSL